MLGVFKMLSCFGQKEKELLPGHRQGVSTVCAHNDSRQAGEKQTNTRFSQIRYKQKVTSIRRKIKNGRYNLGKKLDIAMDRVIEKLCE